jgi:hypothetical protein
MRGGSCGESSQHSTAQHKGGRLAGYPLPEMTGMRSGCRGCCRRCRGCRGCAGCGDHRDAAGDVGDERDVRDARNLGGGACYAAAVLLPISRCSGAELHVFCRRSKLTTGCAGDVRGRTWWGCRGDVRDAGMLRMLEMRGFGWGCNGDVRDVRDIRPAPPPSTAHSSGVVTPKTSREGTTTPAPFRRRKKKSRG